MDPRFEVELRAAVQQLRGELQQAFNQNAGGMRRELAERNATFDKRLADMALIADALRVSAQGGGGNGKGRSRCEEPEQVFYHGGVRIEDIPGRRVPFVLAVDIPIGAGVTSIQQNSVTITQEGPFVAVKRMATFQSQYQFRVTMEDGTTPLFNGRSNGRYRPIHSAHDTMDAQNDSRITTANPSPAGSIGAVFAFPTARSGFRTMEFDGRLRVVNAGSSFPRQNTSIPSSLWTPHIVAPQELGALDFFERGETITVEVTPNHVNNPPFGNANGLAIAGAAGWPFLDGQFDPQEGIVTPDITLNPMVSLTADTVERVPDGLLTVAWEGYRIIQPVAP